jgi:hypothetical protein
VLFCGNAAKQSVRLGAHTRGLAARIKIRSQINDLERRRKIRRALRVVVRGFAGAA